MNLNRFNEFYLNDLLDKLSKENKTVSLLGYFDINPLNYDQGTSTKLLSGFSVLSLISVPYTWTNKSDR